MGLFNNILEKLGLKKKEEDKPTAPAAKPKEIPRFKSTEFTGPVPGSNTAFIKPMSEVDVVTKLDGLAKSNPQKLDWKVSIVDLLKLLEIDSSLAARKELATELGCPSEKIGGDYAEMNVWLHKEVLKRIAANGGNIPKNLLD